MRELDAGGDQRAQQVDGFDHHRPELDELLLVRLRTAEGEDALDQLGGAMHRAPHLAQVLLGRMRLADVHRDEREVAANRRQQVVEIVGDAAGERAHRLHLLRLPQLRLEPVPRLFGLPPLGDVDAGADVAGEPAMRVEAGHGVRRHPAELAVGALQAIVHLERSLRLERGLMPRQHHQALVGVDALGPAVAGGRVQGAAGEFQPAPVEEVAAPIRPARPHQHRRGIGERAEALLALAQRRLGALAVGDVDHHAAQRGRTAVDDVHGHAVLQPDHASVRGEHPVVELVVAPLVRALDAVADRGLRSTGWMCAAQKPGSSIQSLIG